MTLPETLRALAPLLQSGQGRIRIKRDGPTPGIGLTETLYVIVDGLERRVSLLTPEKYWLAEQTPNHYLSSQLCMIRTALEEEIHARGWRLALYSSSEGHQAQLYLGQRPLRPVRGTCAAHAVALALLQALTPTPERERRVSLDNQLELIAPYARRLGLEAYIEPFPPEEDEAPVPSHIVLISPLNPEYSISLDELDDTAEFLRDAFLLAAKQATPPETCFDRWGNRAEVLYRGEGTTGQRTVLARVYDHSSTTSGRLWNGEERVFDQSWQAQPEPST